MDAEFYRSEGERTAAIAWMIEMPLTDRIADLLIGREAFRPGQHGVRRELGAIVQDDHSRLAALFDQRGQFARHPASRDRGVRDCRQAFSGHVIDDVQDTEPAAAGELVMDKIERPAGIRPGLHEDRRSRTYGAASSAPFAHGEAFLPIELVDAVDARWFAQLAQQDEQPAVAEAFALIGKFPQMRAQFGVRWPA